MSITLKRATFGLLLLALVPAFVSCGGSTSNNDQGTSFTATSFWKDAERTVGIAGYNVFLAQDLPSPIMGVGQDIILYMGLDNRLTSQFIRVVRIDCSYDIQGTILRIPDDSTSTSFVIPSAQAGPAANPRAVVPSEGTVGFDILSPDIFAYLNAHINELPQLPFRMTAVCSATGVSQAGDTITTNSLNFRILFSEAAECCSGTGTSGGGGYQTTPGTGGTITYGTTDGTITGTTITAETTTTAPAVSETPTPQPTVSANGSNTTPLPITVH